MTHRNRPSRRDRVHTLTRGEMDHGERNERNLKFARDLASKVFDDPSAFPQNMVVLEIESGILDRLFTPLRVEIVRTLRLDGPVASVDELAARLGVEAEEIALDMLDLDLVGLIEVIPIGKRFKIRAPDCPVIIV